MPPARVLRAARAAVDCKPCGRGPVWLSLWQKPGGLRALMPALMRKPDPMPEPELVENMAR